MKHILTILALSLVVLGSSFPVNLSLNKYIMSTTKLIIRTHPRFLNKDGETQIYNQYSHQQKTTLLSTGLKVKPKDWDSKNQRVRKTVPNHEKINAFLEKQKAKINDIVLQFKFNDQEPTTDKVVAKYRQHRTEINGVKPVKPVSDKSFFEHFDYFIEACKSTKKPNTLRNYTSTRNMLKQFESDTGYKISFKSLNLDFYQKYLDYSTQKLKHKNNTIGKYIKTLKTMLQYYYERGINQYDYFKKFKAFNEANDFIYLEEDEINRLMDVDFEDGKHLNSSRDVFCLACYTGLRFSDIQNLKSGNIKENHIEVNTLKTNETVRIPITSPVRTILDKYRFGNHYRIPRYSNPYVNRALKDIGKQVEIKGKIIKVRNSGSKRVEEVKDKHELITFHTARRSFVTLSLEKGMRPEVLMKITGHQDLKTLQRYIKIIEKVKDAEMIGAWG
ncbi:MAG: site-specific integrase [Cyclobacteriaceae bacterium]|nr:site-specific integrase [Cyclobacteriaceae bacterium]